MKRKYILIGLIVFALIVLFFFEAGRVRKKEIACDALQQHFEQYPLKFDKLKENANRCSFGYQWMGSDANRLEFMADGVYVKIGEKKQHLKSPRRSKPDDDIVKTQITHHDTLIKIFYRSSSEKDSLVDIFADFTFSYQGYFVKGSIRGIYRQNKKAKVKDVPDEVFAQTQDRILHFVDEYFV